MNNARKVREMEEIFFFESKENEINKSTLDKTSKKYDDLKILCRDLIDRFDNKSDIENSIQRIKKHLLRK